MFIDALETILRAEGAGGFWRVQGYKHVASNEAKTRWSCSFLFQLTKSEFDSLRSQIVISKGRGGRRSLPYAFTEHGNHGCKSP